MIFDYQEFRGSGGIGLLWMEGEGTWEPLLTGTTGDQQPDISPDGRWMAYMSQQTGRNEVFVDRFPELGDRQAITAAGGGWPQWSSDGTELFYANGGSVNAVSIDDGAVPTATPETLFNDRYLFHNGSGHVNFAVAPDGQRFLMVQPSGDMDPAPAEVMQFSARAQVVLVLNWFEELKARVPVP